VQAALHKNESTVRAQCATKKKKSAISLYGARHRFSSKQQKDGIFNKHI
jgi:hypothetical protein